MEESIRQYVNLFIPLNSPYEFNLSLESGKANYIVLRYILHYSIRTTGSAIVLCGVV